MASIFKKDDNFVDKPNRNTFDLSFQNNLSLKFGKLIPCLCQEVLPGDSFQIKPTFGLRFLPQVFPVQTRMRAHLHFFYVRNRTIWKDWMDFIGKTKENLVLPYLEAVNSSPNSFKADTSFTESSIYDYFGLPTTIDSSVDPISYNLFTNDGTVSSLDVTENGIIFKDSGISFVSLSETQQSLGQNFEVYYNSEVRRQCIYKSFIRPISVHEDKSFKINMYSETDKEFDVYLLAKASDAEYQFDKFVFLKINFSSLQTLIYPSYPLINTSEGTSLRAALQQIYGYIILPKNSSSTSDIVVNAERIHLAVQVLPSINRRFPFSGLSANTLPYGGGDLQMRINALPFRAYEAVYNSFYRNVENNPFKVDGVPEYNRYVRSIDGGAQPSSDFKLFNRNWEDDAYTTAVPTPQQGNAPRVGLTGNPNEPLALRVYDQDGNISTVNLVANENGQITVVEGFSGETNTIVNALNDAVNFGITINDLRNVNSLQLWLEKNVRKGYKYRDQMLSHYGVAIDYDDLMIPEFIGGVSRDVTVNQISQTVETSDGNLGDMAGQAYVVGDGEHIRKYCPEHGYIIGIVSVVPVPNYNQRIPKHFFKHDTFDYFFPEFGKIGMQPIENKEITPINSWLSRNMEETFGYQRAWYEYLANVDEVHGKFNSDFYNFLLQRKFDEVPELGESFTTVINEDLNNIFYTDSDEDKILGQIYFDIKAIRPIPLFGIPSLE